MILNMSRKTLTYTASGLAISGFLVWAFIYIVPGLLFAVLMHMADYPKEGHKLSPEDAFTENEVKGDPRLLLPNYHEIQGIAELSEFSQKSGGHVSRS